MQDLIVELVEAKLGVTIVQAEVHGLMIHGDAAEPQVEAEAHEQVHEIGIEGCLRRRDLPPFHLAMHLVTLA